MSLQPLFNMLIFGWVLCKQEDLLNQPTEGWNEPVESIRKMVPVDDKALLLETNGGS